MLTSVEHESIHANGFVALDAHPLYQLFLVANRRKCRHEPAISIVSLSNIVCSCAFDEKAWFLKNVLYHRQLRAMW
jgi:hypothetical protein